MAIATASRRLARRALRVVARIWIRLFAFNVLLVFLPAAGLLYLSSYEQQLLVAQEEAMAQEGRVLAAALSELGVAGLEEEDPATGGGLLRLEAQRVLAQLNRQSASRLRVLDDEGRLLADSAQLGPRREPGAPETDLLEPERRRNPLYRLGSGIYRLLEPPEAPAADPGTGVEWSERPEIRRALAGGYGAASRPTPGQRSLTLYSALPIRDGESVAGVVLVSRSTYRILQALYDMRLSLFQVIVASVLAAAVLSLLVATTIVRPLRRLQRQAGVLIDRRGRLRGGFSGSRRADEIGDLARALDELSHRLAEHIAFIESFSADVSHAFKNPLASIRVAAESLGENPDASRREHLIEMVQNQVARMERLLTAARELTRLDVQLEQEPRSPVALAPLLAEICEAYRLRGSDRGIEIALELPPRPLVVEASEERLAQVLENLLDNALGFSPAGGTIVVRLRAAGEAAVIEVEDEGPGIPAAHRETIFTRFFTYRPERPSDDRDPWGHTGLGLAVVRSIVEGYGGSVTAGDGCGCGALLRITLPRLDPAPGG